MPKLTHDSIVTAAVAVADDGGLRNVTMRRVGRQLDVEAMSLYHHVRSKNDLLNELADWPFGQIELPNADDPWRRAMTSRARSARDVLGAHPWALGLVESRPDPGPAVLRHHDAILGCLRGNGFPIALAAHAFAAIDAYIYGFVLTELSLPFQPSTDGVADTVAPPIDTYPHLAELFTEHISADDYRFADEFDYGLDLVLDGLERRLGRE